VALLAVARRRADGVKVLLNGEGSDELFGGYGTHARAFGPGAGAHLARARPLATAPPARRRDPASRSGWLIRTAPFGARGFAVIDGDGERAQRAVREARARSFAGRSGLPVPV
jgi:asparagine synthetase B (glutamine-hydrolysing)